MVHKIHRQTVLSVSVWFLHLPAPPLLLGTLAAPQQCCLCLQDVNTANSREALATSDSGWNLRSCTLNCQKKGWQDVWGTFTATHASGACSTARESSICRWNCQCSHLAQKYLHLWTAVKPEIPDIKTCTYGKELHVPCWNINSLVHLQQENT